MSNKLAAQVTGLQFDSEQYPVVRFETPGRPSSAADLGYAYEWPCIQPGTWEERDAGDGRVICAFEVVAAGGPHTQTNAIGYLSKLLAGASVDTHPRVYPRVFETKLLGKSEERTYARLYGGSIRSLDHHIADRFHSKNVARYQVTYIRAKFVERDAAGYPDYQVNLGIESPHGEAVELVGFSDVQFPTRLWRVSVKPEKLDETNATVSSAFKNIWMGILPNRTDGTATNISGTEYWNLLNPVIDLDYVDFEGLDAYSDVHVDWYGPYPVGALSGAQADNDWSGTNLVSLGFKRTDTDNLSQWNNRFFMQLQNWNETLHTYEQARFNMPGRYHVLMRYSVANNGEDTKAQIGIEVHGAHHGAPYNFIESAGRKYIKYEDEYLHWVDLGELDVGGPDYSYEMAHHSSPNHYCIAIQAALLNATEREKGNEDVDGVRLFIDRFVLVPSDNFIHVSCPLSVQSQYLRRLDIITDDQMNVSAYVVLILTDNLQKGLVNEGDNQVTTIAKVTDIEANNWSIPPLSQNGKLVIIAEYDGQSESGYYLTVDLHGIRRSEEFFT